MEVTEIRIKLTGRRNDKLRAFCTVTFDNCFVVRDLKVIEGARGPFVAMPSRKLTSRCPKCGGKNHLRARFCNDCGGRCDSPPADPQGRERLHADIAHPINVEARETLEKRVLSAYAEEVERSKQPGYQPVEMNDPFDDDAEPMSM